MKDEINPEARLCEHRLTYFPNPDSEHLKGLSARQIRKLYPRFDGKCSCGFEGIYYASWAQCVYGDY